MVELACRTERRDGVTLVEAVVENDGGVTRRVRLESTLDGPAWPPRRRGVPVDDWNADAVARTLAPGERAGVGFASPAPPASPPVRVAESRRVEAGGEGDASGEGGEATDAADVVRRLGDPSPPRDAVPPSDPEAGAKAVAEATSEGNDGERDGTRHEGRAGTGDEGVPAPVAEWFAAVEERVEAAESCAAATTLPEATRAVEDAGDLAAVESALDRLAADAAALRAASRRSESLADRAEAVDGEVPVAALRTLS
ncbi:hypothetical protein G9464_02125 [Halostella sp. JP-L12]|uniref:DUF7857 domain-containing protein n=1 Tax=Halostella TaxID=1843185 RepID=UPI000EF780F0|nr:MULTISPECIES: hypothetical protein [Halostella]NHN46399.1 hypothetical protein [Halostella sp. JP-L12]